MQGPSGHPKAVLLPISAREPEELRALTETYAAFLAEESTPAAVDVCFTAGAGRVHQQWRTAVSGAGTPALVAALQELDDAPAPQPASVIRPRVVFVFPGQGGQWLGMGRELLGDSKVFATTIAECAEAIDAELGWSMVDRLRSDRPLSAVEEIQPALWAIQVSLASVWQHWGIEPDLIVGHSLGEIAAATVAGALSIEDGARVVCRRSMILRDAAPGAMWTVGLGEREARQAIGTLADRVCVGVLNSDRYSVLSGDPEAVSEVVQPLLDRGVFCRRVKVSYASHSPQAEGMRSELLKALSDLTPRAGTVPMHSTAWDAPVSGYELDAEYWMANLRSPVRFASAVRLILESPVPTVFVELSAHPTLVTALSEAIEDANANATVVSSLRRKRPDLLSMLEGLGAAYTAGCDPLWSRLYSGGATVPLPGLDG